MSLQSKAGPVQIDPRILIFLTLSLASWDWNIDLDLGRPDSRDVKPPLLLAPWLGTGHWAAPSLCFLVYKKMGFVGRLVGDDKAASEALRIPPGRQEAFSVKVPSFAQAALMPDGPFL